MQDNLYSDEVSREKLIAGIKKASAVVGGTMGTSGHNALIECFEHPKHFTTNDGITILSAMKFSDPLEEMGRQLLEEAVSRANRASGDGSSTTCVLCSSILETAQPYLKDISPMELQRQLEDCIPLIEDSLKAQRKEITVDTVGQVATISAESEDIGNRIQEIYQKIGKNGIINWDTSKTPEDSYSIGNGITIHDAKYATQYMSDVGMSEARLDDVAVLLCGDKITSALEIDALCGQMFEKGHRQLALFCDDIDAVAVYDILQTQRLRGFRTVVIKMPVLWRDEWWEDLVLASGGKLISKTVGKPLPKATVNDLGAFQHVIVKRDETIIEGIQDLSKHILALQVDGSDEALNRVARLNTMTARYFVGAHSESALKQKRDKVEDAINAASCALEHGILPGGGVALVFAGMHALQETKGTVGAKILQVALEAPFDQIVKNAGIKNAQARRDGWGIDTRTGEFVDMFKVGVVDAYDVVLNAVKSAIGVSASVLTTKSTILLPKDDSPQMPRV